MADWLGRGVTAGFGGYVGTETLQTLAAKGWRLIRNGSQLTGVMLEQLAQEITTAGMIPVIATTASFASSLPAGVIAELRAEPDTSVGGAEPNILGADPIEEAVVLNALVPMLKQKGVTAYAGQFGWDQNALTWGRLFLEHLDPFYRVSVHRYPPSNATDFSDLGAHGFYAFRMALGTRNWAVLECGWNQGPYKTFWDKVFGRHHHLDDALQKQAIDLELLFYQGAGADFACVYQLNDEPTPCPQHPHYAANWRGAFGLRRGDGTWKPSADVGR